MLMMMMMLHRHTEAHVRLSAHHEICLNITKDLEKRAVI